ncbi:MAG TPA: hypothetical protein VJ821_14200 [Anaerolineales bacterium]|nr:hypothetical protein [Anaerolineales bacterium]
MAIRVATMTPFSPVDSSSPVRETDSLFRKVVLLALLITAAAAWIAVLFKSQAGFPLLLSTFFADASLGLIAGFGTRFVLQKREWLAQLIVAIFLTMFGMIMIGFFTRSVFGIGPIELERRTAEGLRQLRVFDRDLVAQINAMNIDSRRLLEFDKMDWADPVHLGISLIMTALALQGWRRAEPPQPVEVIPLPPPAPARRRSTRSKRGRRSTLSSAASSSNGEIAVALPGSWSTRLIPGHTPTPRTRSNNGSRSTVLREPKKTKTKDQVVRPKRKRSRRKPQIQFALVEEHRCPYCLDVVTHHDPRGVKECEVCHTLHHADCWVITGFCQVPHLNT